MYKRKLRLDKRNFLKFLYILSLEFTFCNIMIDLAFLNRYTMKCNGKKLFPQRVIICKHVPICKVKDHLNFLTKFYMLMFLERISQ